MKPINNSEYDESCPIIAFDYLNESWNLINLFFELLFLIQYDTERCLWKIELFPTSLLYTKKA